ncbi:hypothetical protein SISNIDRAFT_457211 [Sistotremastrum niveocremeum HHB9708]|uniref:F-box domain-containing protein n=1 Tax=Sistotremastrum niveocremeum HHB9708 TaxID=1314777 RepID=A0A164RTZ6_9AGAM|nr:hypothetical protein SISNIDRAFT_457211 [Sistotremastrum niveocremeum HHB9708]
MPRKPSRKAHTVNLDSSHEAIADSESQTQAVLPQELWRNIVDEVATSDSNPASRKNTLRNLSLTCRSLCAEAQRILYRDIMLEDGTEMVRQISQALHGGAAKHVQALHIGNYHGIPGRRGRSSETFCVSLPFDRMDNLRSLSIESKGYIAYPERTIALCRFLSTSIKPNSLTTVHWPILLDNSLYSVLETQNSITDLSIMGIGTLDLARLKNPQFLPVLKRVKSSACTGTNMKELVQGRPVAVIHSPPYLDELEPCLSYAPHLTALDLSGITIYTSDGMAASQRIVSAAVNLRVLLSYRFVFYPNEVDLPNRVFGVFHTLAHLRSFGIILELRDQMPPVGGDATVQQPVNALQDIVLPHNLQTLFVSNTRHNLFGSVTATQLRQRTIHNGWDIREKQGDSDPVEWFDSEIREI